MPTEHFAYVPADVALWPALTGGEILELLGNVGPSVDIDYRTELVERFQLDLERPGKAYSSGNRQKVALVAAFATRAPLLVLDEPTSGLDPLMEQRISQVRRRGEKARPDRLPQFPSARRSRGVVRSGRDSSGRTIGGDRHHRRPAAACAEPSSRSVSAEPHPSWTTSRESRISIISTATGCASIWPAHPRLRCAPWPRQTSLRWPCGNRRWRRFSSTTTAKRSDEHRRLHHDDRDARRRRLGGRSLD